MVGQQSRLEKKLKVEFFMAVAGLYLLGWSKVLILFTHECSGTGIHVRSRSAREPLLPAARPLDQTEIGIQNTIQSTSIEAQLSKDK